MFLLKSNEIHLDCFDLHPAPHIGPSRLCLSPTRMENTSYWITLTPHLVMPYMKIEVPAQQLMQNISQSLIFKFLIILIWLSPVLLHGFKCGLKYLCFFSLLKKQNKTATKLEQH